jgi:molecular chaperone DnaJ
MTRTREANVLVQYSAECSACGGRGTVIDQACPRCSGRAEIAQEEALEITIPPGVEDGMVLRVAGRGRPAAQPGGLAGDLYARIVSAPDDRFARSGSDLWREETIPVFDAVLGTTLRVPTLSRSATVRVPPGTQPGTVLRLRGQGLPEFRGRGRGDLLVRILVRVPERPGKDEKDLYERLRTIAAGSAVVS